MERRLYDPRVNFLRALGWTVIVFLVSAFVGGIIVNQLPATPPINPLWAIGAILTLLLALRGGYRPDWQGWVLLLLGPIGWLIMLWRRANQLAKGSASGVMAPNT